MATPWWQLGITQAHGQNGELGVDVGTPFHTNITDIFSGTVVDAGYHAWGGQVDIATTLPNGQHVIEQFLHLDQIAAGITTGAQVVAGQFLGLSGGQTSGGAHPASTQFSTGPHTEFGLYSGTPGASTALDPTAYLAYGSGAGIGGSTPMPSSPPSFWQTIIDGITGATLGASITQVPPGALPAVSGAIAGAATPGAVSSIPDALNAVGARLQQSVANAGLILLALVFVAFGLALLLWPAAKEAAQGTAETAGKVAEVAAVA